MHAWCLWRSEKAADLLKLELQMALSLCVDTRNPGPLQGQVPLTTEQSLQAAVSQTDVYSDLAYHL